MRTVTALELRGRMGELLDAASAGERILIERDHRPMAVLVSVEDAHRLDEDRDERRKRISAALDRLDEYRARMARLHPEELGGPDAATIIRQERDARGDRLEEVIRLANAHARARK
jgi:prevent-host-death family protein